MMKLTVLMENTTSQPELVCTHGLSVYLENSAQRILFDMGPGAQFAQNAQALGVDLAAVDYAVLSHGHYDHGGGLDVFLRRNDHAPVYLRQGAFLPHTDAAGKNIGLAANLQSHARLIETGPFTRIDQNALLFSDVTGTAFQSPINTALLECGAPDRFSHEQNLLLWEGEKLFLFGGCAHCGIVNILEKAAQLAGRMPDVVFSGMHLSVGASAPVSFTRALAEKLLEYPCVFYTCHCTGMEPYQEMKPILKDRLHYAAAGDIFVL